MPRISKIQVFINKLQENIDNPELLKYIINDYQINVINIQREKRLKSTNKYRKSTKGKSSVKKTFKKYYDNNKDIINKTRREKYYNERMKLRELELLKTSVSS